MKTISIRAFIKAMRKNGYPKNKGDYYGPDNSACAFGQAARNLTVDASRLDEAFGRWFANNDATNPANNPLGKGINWGPHIVFNNDKTNMTIPEIADYTEKWLTDHGYNLDEHLFV